MKNYYCQRVVFIGCAMLYFCLATFGNEGTSGSEEQTTKAYRQIADSLRHTIIEIDKVAKKNAKAIDQKGLDIDSLKGRISVLSHEIENINKALSIEKKNIVTVKEYSESKSAEFKHIILQRTWAIGSAILLLILIGIATVIIIRMRLRIKDKLIGERIDIHKDKLDEKLAKVMELQMSLLGKERAEEKVEIRDDHSLPLRVGNEIHRMKCRIEQMSEQDKNAAALKKAIERLEDQFNTNGYQIIELINQKFDDGMTVRARFIPSPQLKTGERVITRIVEPQINYKGVLIQRAEVEVSKGE